MFEGVSDSSSQGRVHFRSTRARGAERYREAVCLLGLSATRFLPVSHFYSGLMKEVISCSLFLDKCGNWSTEDETGGMFGE